MKSKNQQWKESGSNLSFKDWMKQDLANSVQRAIDESKSILFDVGYVHSDGIAPSQDLGVDAKTPPTAATPDKAKKIFGMNQTIIYGAAFIAVVIITANVYRHIKTKK